MMSEIENEYVRSGIWTMQSSRTTCVVPENPLVITSQEERDLTDIARGVWRSVSAITEYAEVDTLRWQSIRNKAAAFPEGLTMPPAIRVDVVRTQQGPRIVEVDPITALSLGETVFLDTVWQQAGYQTVTGLLDVLVQGIDEKSALGIDLSLPQSKEEYDGEIGYLADCLSQRGIECKKSSKVNISDPRLVQLSAYMEDSVYRRYLNRNPSSLTMNPLWGSLYGISSKENLEIMQKFEQMLLPKFLPNEYSRDELTGLDQNQLVVCKPSEGTGSQGVRALSPSEALNVPRKYVFQELLEPLLDNYGVCKRQDGSIIEGSNWVTRLSIYASRIGLVGVQATARQYEGKFTNAHGQSDAVQTTAVINN